MKEKISKFHSVFLWVLTLFFFASQYIGRNSLAILEQEIINKFNISAGYYAVCGALFYVSYALMQIPFGYLFDKYHIRYVLFYAILIYVSGVCIFATTNSLLMLFLARVLIGIGSVAGFLGAAKVVGILFKDSVLYGLTMSLTFTIGFLGGIFSTGPMRMLVEIYKWEHLYLMAAGFTLLIGFLVLFFGKIPYETKGGNSNIISNLKIIVRNKVVVIASLAGGLMVGAIDGFSDLWCVPLLELVYGHSKTAASFAASIILAGMCIGGPLLCFLGKGKYKEVVVVSGLILALTIFIVTFYNLSYNFVLLNN